MNEQQELDKLRILLNADKAILNKYRYGTERFYKNCDD